MDVYFSNTEDAIMPLDSEFSKLIRPIADYKEANFSGRGNVIPHVDHRKQKQTKHGIVTTVQFTELGNVIDEVEFLYRDGEWIEL